jgi:predicted O-methyltransferase YrrM
MQERDEYRPGMDLVTYARAWKDMEPHLGHLMDLASRARVVVEFGIRGAVSSWAILDGLPPDGVLVGVDINPDCSVPERVRMDPRWTFVVGDSVKVDLPRHADLVMIDSSHEYEQTVLELERAATLTPDVIALHDYLYADTPAVKQAVDEFVASDAPYALEVVHPSQWGLAVLRRT